MSAIKHLLRTVKSLSSFYTKHLESEEPPSIPKIILPCPDDKRTQKQLAPTSWYQKRPERPVRSFALTKRIMDRPMFCEYGQILTPFPNEDDTGVWVLLPPFQLRIYWKNFKSLPCERPSHHVLFFSNDEVTAYASDLIDHIDQLLEDPEDEARFVIHEGRLVRSTSRPSSPYLSGISHDALVQFLSPKIH